MGAAGLVLGRDKKFGLRIDLGNFASAWAKLKPGIEPPSTKVYRHTYKIHPMPLGLDKDKVETWAQNNGWLIRALRAMGAKHWLVISDEPPPNILTFNTHPILVQLQPQKGFQSPGAIAAGLRHVPKQKPVTNPAPSHGLGIQTW